MSNRNIDWQFFTGGLLLAFGACYCLWCAIMNGGMGIRRGFSWWISGEQAITVSIIQAFLSLWSFWLAFHKKKGDKQEEENPK